MLSVQIVRLVSCRSKLLSFDQAEKLVLARVGIILVACGGKLIIASVRKSLGIELLNDIVGVAYQGRSGRRVILYQSVRHIG